MTQNDPLYDLESRIFVDTHEQKPTYVLQGRNRTYIKLNEHSYQLLRSIQASGSFEAVAQQMSRADRAVTAQEVEEAYRTLTHKIQAIENSPAKRPAGFWLQIPLIPERVVERLASALAPIFTPAAALLAIAIIIAAFLVIFWNGVPLFAIGANDLGGAYALFFISLIFHELGHASACARYGAKPSSIGFAMYLFFPALYSDVSSSWQLRRWQRVVVDVGGMFFQLLVGSIYIFAYAWMGWPALRVAFAMILYNVLLSLNPFFKFDGYWVMVDMLGITNLRAHILRVVRSLLARLLRRPAEHLNMRAREVIFLLIYSAVSLAVWLYFSMRFALFAIHWLTIYPTALQHLIDQVARNPRAVDISNLTSVTITTAVLLALLYLGLKAVRPYRGVGLAAPQTSKSSKPGQQ